MTENKKVMVTKKLNFIHILEQYHDYPALVWGQNNLTYHQYFKYINYISGILKNKGIHSGKRVALLSEISYDFPILFFAILTLGGIVIPINPRFPTQKVHALLKEMQCHFVLTYDMSLSKNLSDNMNVISLHSIFDKSMPSGGAAEIPSLELEQDATIVLTSGTLGKPRGVLHTIGNHYFSAEGSNQNIILKHDDCWMVCLPFYHIAGIAILFRTLIAGAACFISDSSRNISHQIKNHHVTHVSLVATQLHRWTQNNKTIESARLLKAILLGGSQIPKVLIEKALQLNLPVFASYGSTEMSSQITTTSNEDLINDSGSSGKVLPYRELTICENGEILVKGKTLCRGYVTDKEIINCVDKNGWFYTGDLGYYDKNNNLIVQGRRDNMFISGGENIYPEEIEEHLQRVKNIANVCVVGIPDDEYGTKPVAFLKMDGTDKIDESQLNKYLENKIARYKIPLRFFTWPENVGRLKPDRKYLREVAIVKSKKE